MGREKPPTGGIASLEFQLCGESDPKNRGQVRGDRLQKSGDRVSEVKDCRVPNLKKGGKVGIRNRGQVTGDRLGCRQRDSRQD